MRDPLEADKISGAEIESVTPILLLLVVAFAFFFFFFGKGATHASSWPTIETQTPSPPPLFPVSASGV